jgi:hypothetical protein
MLGYSVAVDIQLLAFGRELDELGFELGWIVKCTGVNRHNFRRVIGRAEQ